MVVGLAKLEPLSFYPVKVSKLEPTKIVGVILLSAVSEDGRVKVELELPRKVAVFSEGDVIEVTLDNAEIENGLRKDLYVNGLIYKFKPINDQTTIYLSIGGLRAKVTMPTSLNKFKLMEKAYLAMHKVDALTLKPSS
ncbi:MAG: DNA-directed RNA polymerase subunit G [Candidatus Nezhaarchaeales archaeon]